MIRHATLMDLDARGREGEIPISRMFLSKAFSAVGKIEFPSAVLFRIRIHWLPTGNEKRSLLESLGDSGATKSGWLTTDWQVSNDITASWLFQ